MKLNRIALAVFLAAPLALSAQAAVTVTPLLGMYTADEPTGATIDDGVYAGLAAGIQFTPAFALEAEYGNSGDTKLFGGHALVSPYSFRMGAVAPYILGGFSQSKISANAGSSEDTTVDLGGGLKYTLTDNLTVRGELRLVSNSDHSLTNYLALAGLEYNFGSPDQGGGYEPEPAPVQRPITPADTDGDGVVDANDRCPNTPAGWEVGMDGCPLDADKDRVPNSIDECPNTPMGQPVGANGCPMDDDKDGVINVNDKCPATPASEVVDDKGCTKTVTIAKTEKIESKINVVFDTNRAVIKPEFEKEVAKIADLAKANANAFITIEGHTDSSGSPAKNKLLSQQRAEAVRMKLINDFQIDAARVSAVGFGSAKPVADNKTAEGKAQNRRVIAVLTAQKQTMEVKKVTKPVKKAVKKGKKGKKGVKKAVKK